MKKVSVREYATLCGITEMAVHQRVNAGTLKWASNKPQKTIDIEKYPPVTAIKKGRRPYKSAFLD